MIDNTRGGNIVERHIQFCQLGLDHLFAARLNGVILFFEYRFQLCLGARGGNNIDPAWLRQLRLRGENFHLIATFQLVIKRHKFMVNFGANAVQSNIGVKGESKIERGRFGGHFANIALRGEHINFASIEVQAKSVHKLHSVGVVGCVEHIFQRLEPRIEVGQLVGASFVFPVRRQAVFGNLVHALGTNLHLHPVAFVAHQRNMQCLVTVGFWCAEPVARAVGVFLVERRER